MRSFVKENNWLTRDFMDFGWGNGYVIIPKGHPLHGLDYNEINDKGIDVHYGLTMSANVEDCTNWKDTFLPEEAGGWVVGFDTAHHMDTLNTWPKEAVEAETERLKRQFENFK